MGSKAGAAGKLKMKPPTGQLLCLTLHGGSQILGQLVFGYCKSGLVANLPAHSVVVVDQGEGVLRLIWATTFSRARR